MASNLYVLLHGSADKKQLQIHFLRYELPLLPQNHYSNESF